MEYTLEAIQATLNELTVDGENTQCPDFVDNNYFLLVAMLENEEKRLNDIKEK